MSDAAVNLKVDLLKRQVDLLNNYLDAEIRDPKKLSGFDFYHENEDDDSSHHSMEIGPSLAKETEMLSPSKRPVYVENLNRLRHSGHGSFIGLGTKSSVLHRRNSLRSFGSAGSSLPDVEEYKAQIQYRRNSSFNSLKSMTLDDSNSVHSELSDQQSKPSPCTDSEHVTLHAGLLIDASSDFEEKGLKLGLRLKKCSRCPLLLIVLSVVAAGAFAVALAVKRKPRSSRSTDVFHFLSENEVSSYDQMTTPGTPQNKAAIWIADVDGRYVSLSQKDTFIQRYVLAVLYYSLGGDVTWPPNYLNFLSRSSICDWNKSFNTKAGVTGTLGVKSCQMWNGESVPTSIALRKLSFRHFLLTIITVTRHLRSLFVICSILWTSRYNPRRNSVPRSVGVLRHTV